MALPKNSHHVHSDGYYSEKGEADLDRMLEELADEIEQIPGVLNVWPEVEHDGEPETYEQIEDEAAEWDCGVTSVSGDWCMIRRE
jgi:hypothetical protein